MQTLGVSVKQLRRKLLELGARILHVQGSKPRDMALVVRVCALCTCVRVRVRVCVYASARAAAFPSFPARRIVLLCDTCVVLRGREGEREREPSSRAG